MDVRTRAELDYVGRIPGSVEIEWQSYPGGQPNPTFLAELRSRWIGKSWSCLFAAAELAPHSAADAAVVLAIRRPTTSAKDSRATRIPRWLLNNT